MGSLILQLTVLFSHFLLLTTLTWLPILTLSQPDFLHHRCYNRKGYYTANSTYQRNLNTLLFSSSLPSNAATNSGFYNLSVGRNSDQVNALAVCRGDTTQDDCLSCLTDAANKITQVCPLQKKAIGVYQYCLLRYSNTSIYGVKEEIPLFMAPQNINNATNETKFSETLQKLLERLRSAAASPNNLRKFATGNETAGPFETIYALVQCSRDLSNQDCEKCLTKTFAAIPGCCRGTKIGLTMIKPSCDMRYHNFLFYRMTEYETTGSAPPPSPGLEPVRVSPPPSLPPPTTTKGNGADEVVMITVPTVAGIVIVLSMCICIFLRAWKQKPKDNVTSVNEIESEECLRFDLAAVIAATANFSEENKLGQGGFGAVYKGTLRNGQDVAVKRLSKGSFQGDEEFKNEILLLARLQHRNLVRLLGFCLDRKERLLIYEFVPNTSLDHLIFDPIKREQLDWLRCYKIIQGIARGLLYLHEESRLKIIHRDLKASNILLDAEMNPKISDFGLARLVAMDQSGANTSRIAGTYGYMAPEYVLRGHFSVKSDVFSFGVLLLEIVCGQKNVYVQRGENVQDLLSYVWKNWSQGTPMNVIDPTLRRGSQTEVVKCIHIGLLCVQENVDNRPTMATVVLTLNSPSLSLPIPLQPPFFMDSSTASDQSLMSRSSQPEEKIPPRSTNEASISELSPR